MDDCKRSCIDCTIGSCNLKDSPFPGFCTTVHMDDNVLHEAMDAYTDPENRKVTIAAAEVEADNYMRMTRLEETIEFAKKIGAKKIGIATCLGLLKESNILAKILRSHGFEVVGAACKAGMQKKTRVGIPVRCDVVGENMCNPVLQAKLLNEAGTDLNILMGLCVGHDSMFYKYSEALVTTLVAKDRVLAHNPVAAIYQSDKYLSRVYGGE